MVTCQSGRPLSFRENRKSDLLSRNKRSTTALTREEDILLSARVIRGVFQGVKQTSSSLIFVYYESMKRKLKIKPICECRCTGRLQTKRFGNGVHYCISHPFKRRNWCFGRFIEFLLSRLFFCFMSFKPSRK